ncbi:MAG: hypothetical protein M1830_008948 [Pleopsidium flavum]|nr:MAG: hypothetical protein M1830_008948 [Pleopsidium flavum]
MEGNDTVEIDFCTLGMFIIDDIEFPPPKEPVADILGGAGSWSALGARLFSPPPKSESVGWVVDVGLDFPVELRQIIQSWETSCVMRETPHRKTTRGHNIYGENEERAFKYVEEKLRIDHSALPQSHLLARSFHLICNPTRCIDLVTNILAERSKILQRCHSLNHPSRPLFIWEPVPDRCTEDEKNNMYQALKFIDVLSPNYVELSGFYGGGPSPRGEIDRQFLSSMCIDALLKGFGMQKKGAVVVRAGSEGCFVASHRMEKWFPAYHEPPADPQAGPNRRVVDPTGGGNAFLGGLSIGLVRTGYGSGLDNLELAAAFASVAASFAIEQVGVPMLTHSPDGSELWNGVSVAGRLDEYTQNVASFRRGQQLSTRPATDHQS